ncbi:MAG: cytochrome c [Burkholderiales bacterium]
MTSRFLLVTATALALTVSAHAAGDAANGKTKTFACQGCHGIPGTKTAFPDLYSVPKLGGQHPQYIVSALKAYKAGQRNHTTMQANAATLSDQDMEDIAAYYGAK